MRISDPLKVEVVEGLIVISIGVDTLSKVSLPDQYGYGEFKVTNHGEFAKSVVRALEHEQEDGTTVVHEMFDKALMHCIEQGDEGFVIDEDEPA